MSDAKLINETSEIVAAIERDGFTILPGVVDEAGIARVLSDLSKAQDSAGVRRRGSVFAIRNLCAASPEVALLAERASVRAPVEAALGASCFVVRSILFDKTPEANWKVAWHQDLSIAVRARREAEDFGAWSEKAGVMHAQPPVEILERMLTVRIHLDACGEENAPLRVFPGSHAAGRLSAASIARWQERVTPTTCLVPRGGALLMRPLLLHASSASRTPEHRRVAHLEYAAEQLPGGLEWMSDASRIG